MPVSSFPDPEISPSIASASSWTKITTLRVKCHEENIDDLVYLVTLKNLRQHIADAGFELVREDLEISKLAKKILPASLVAKIPDIPFARNILITNMEYILT